MTACRPGETSQFTAEPLSLDDPTLYINRETSWLQFNGWILEEAMDPAHPLLERVKFLSIFAKNLDEFFMIRVAGLRQLMRGGALQLPPDGMTPAEQLAAIRATLAPQLAQQARYWIEELAPALQQHGITIHRYHGLDEGQRDALRAYFAREIFPVLTPLAFDPAHPFPHISNLSLNLAVVVRDAHNRQRFARVKVADTLPRLVPVPDREGGGDATAREPSASRFYTFVWMEDIIAANLDMLFRGLEVVAVFPFRLTRDTDLAIQDDLAADLLANIEEQVERRHFGTVVRLELPHDAHEPILDVLIRNLHVEPQDVYATDAPLGLGDLEALLALDRPDLKYPPFSPAIPKPLQTRESRFAVFRREDVLLYHPYDSFLPVVEFIQEAARDPQVLAIKQTLYRVGNNSPIVQALLEAREQRKHVAVLVELKARFDEAHNIAWARALEQAGAHVAYGVLGLTTHCKVCLVVRREPDGLRRYVHLSTGNYNHVTSRSYADLGYFTCDEAIGADVADLFNALTGYTGDEAYHKLLVAPGALRQQIVSRIEREIDRQRHHGDGYLAFKMNALVDKACIQALYRASQAGVKIDLQVRGICCLRPGIPGVSESIRVTAVVGRFLEHARMYYFRNGGQEELWLGSADLMPRNLDRRVEILFPVEVPHLRDAIVHALLKVHLRDNVQARRLCADGRYERLRPASNAEALSAQAWLLEHWCHEATHLAYHTQLHADG